MRALLALPLLALSACAAQAEDVCVGEIELLQQQRDAFVATQMEALKVLHEHSSPPGGTPPSAEELRVYSDLMARLEATNNRIAVRIRDCPAFVRKAGEQDKAAPVAAMPEIMPKESQQ
ncbi:hypothetical protein [Parerythrobacter lacustris]|uniref:Uncharacterized protein n=1 Tax=Parerythrobacter lacustris TaxID=2969984 RepID=A0ABT1XKX6_9SPHN|nr:hypothetical protein [Parerythrobacter lacustris]MCR2832326.1 hypothetical protein [Parerythrobacter lacustris]